MSERKAYTLHADLAVGVTYVFDEGTQIMLDRSYCDFSGVEYEIIELPWEIHTPAKKQNVDVVIRITEKGLCKFQLNFPPTFGPTSLRTQRSGPGRQSWYTNFLVSLERHLAFDQYHDEEVLEDGFPAVREQILNKLVE